jgi:hypothetical protein
LGKKQDEFMSPDSEKFNYSGKPRGCETSTNPATSPPLPSGGETSPNGRVSYVPPEEESIAHEYAEEAKTSTKVAPSLEDAGVSHTLEGLECLLKEKPEYANERDPEVIIDAVAASPDMFFVPTREEMVEAMKTKELEPDTTALPVLQRNMRSASKKNEPSEIEITMRRIQRAPFNEGRWNGVQLWVGEKGKLWIYYPEYEPVTIYQICSWLHSEGYFSYPPPEEEVERVLKEMIKEVNRAKRRHNKRQKENGTRS